MRATFLLFILSALIMTAPAGAQGIYFGPQAGYQKASGADDGDFLGGAALRVKFTPAFGAEGSILYRQEKFSDGDVTVRSWPVQATGFFYPVPYVYAAVGGGWYHTTFDYRSALNDAGTPDNTTENFGWHFGGGVEIPLGNTLALTGDIRYVFLDYDFKGLPGRDIDSDFFMVTAGLLFHLF